VAEERPVDCRCIETIDTARVLDATRRLLTAVAA
jgi:hypothetical protein